MRENFSIFFINNNNHKIGWFGAVYFVCLAFNLPYFSKWNCIKLIIFFIIKMLLHNEHNHFSSFFFFFFFYFLKTIKTKQKVIFAINVSTFRKTILLENHTKHEMISYLFSRISSQKDNIFMKIYERIGYYILGQLWWWKINLVYKFV